MKYKKIIPLCHGHFFKSNIMLITKLSLDLVALEMKNIQIDWKQ